MAIDRFSIASLNSIVCASRFLQILLTFIIDCSQVEEEEELWTEVIDKYGKLDAEWVPDIVSRAWGNRGNSRSRQVGENNISSFIAYFLLGCALKEIVHHLVAIIVVLAGQVIYGFSRSLYCSW